MADILEIERCPLDYYCAKTWSELNSTDNPKIKFCRECSSQVYFCETIEEFDARALVGECVAFLVYKDCGESKVIEKPLGLPKRK